MAQFPVDLLKNLAVGHQNQGILVNDDVTGVATSTLGSVGPVGQIGILHVKQRMFDDSGCDASECSDHRDNYFDMPVKKFYTMITNKCTKKARKFLQNAN